MATIRANRVQGQYLGGFVVSRSLPFLSARSLSFLSFFSFLSRSFFSFFSFRSFSLRFLSRRSLSAFSLSRVSRAAPTSLSSFLASCVTVDDNRLRLEILLNKLNLDLVRSRGLREISNQKPRIFRATKRRLKCVHVGRLWLVLHRWLFLVALYGLRNNRRALELLMSALIA